MSGEANEEIAHKLIKPDQAYRILDQLMESAVAGVRVLSRIELLLLGSKVLIARNRRADAVVSVKEAVSLAEKGDFMAMFLNEGSSVADLLDTMVRKETDIPRAFANKLLAAFRLPRSVQTDDGVVERLSERELEVLRLVAGGLSNKMIVEKLYISMSTVKMHLRNIYGKLNVNSRTQSVAKAKKLDLLQSFVF